MIYVDADACPVKDETVRVADRHGLPVLFVSNAWMRLPTGMNVQRVVVPEGPDVADNWIAERANAGSIVITADIPLAARCVKAGARVLKHDGSILSDANIGNILASRNLMHDLREIGAATTYTPAFSRQDRSKYLQALELAARAIAKPAA